MQLVPCHFRSSSNSSMTIVIIGHLYFYLVRIGDDMTFFFLFSMQCVKSVIFKKKLLDDVHPGLLCVTTMVIHAFSTNMVSRGSACLAMLSLTLGDSSRVDGRLDACAGEMTAASNVFYRIHGRFIFISYFCKV